MTTYKTLYHLMVRSMSEAIDLYDEGKGILAREVLKKALLDAEDQVISHDIISDEPISNDYSSADQQKAKKAVPLSGERSNAAPSEATAGWIIQKGGARPLPFGR